MNHVGGVIARVLDSSAVDRSSILGRVKPKTKQPNCKIKCLVTIDNKSSDLKLITY
jgi:hypothetical protein